MEARIFLVGYMGCGKTTLGKALAAKLELPFIDIDEQLEKRTGKTIPQLFNEEGEEQFRVVEHEFLIQLLRTSPRFVCATGGGTPCFFNNMQLMNQEGETIYLQLSPEELYQRLQPQINQRPLIAGLKDEGLRPYIKRHLEEREGYYLKAKHVVEGKEGAVEAIVTKLQR